MAEPSAPTVPLLDPEELARRLDTGEALQLLDVRAPEYVAGGRVHLGVGLEYHALPGSSLANDAALEALHLDHTRPVAVICGHGNSSRPATALLKAHGFDAYSVHGGMARWESVYLARTLAPTASLERVVQVDRVGKGCLGYVLVSEGQAVVVDPGRHIQRYDDILRQLDAAPVAVIDTHMHADYLSGARIAAAQWNVPYRVHPADAVSPYDGTPGRFSYVPLVPAEPFRFGRATLRVELHPGHTLGSVTLMADDALVLTGDLLFVASVGRPDLGEQAEVWGRLLWRSLNEACRTWPPEALVLPAHYASETERRADRAVGARLDVITATNEALQLTSEDAFLRWLADHRTPAPEAYRTIKLANLGLAELSPEEVEAVEIGPNRCAVA